MPKVDQKTKQKRKDLVYNYVLRNDLGVTEKKIADDLSLGQRGVNNYLRELSIEGKVDKEGHLWFAYVYRRTRLRQFELSPEEAMTLYLATRLLTKQHDKRNESAETALRKLAEVLTGDVGVGQEIYQAALELAQRPGDPSYSRIFRKVMQSYIYRHSMQITYEPLNGKSFETTFSPYLLEPSAIGYATYVIGHSSNVDALRTYKLERIRSATLMHEEYNIPADFPGLEYLRSAWNIISGENLISVQLRFRTARAAKRVHESVWHPSQEIADDPENPVGCIWSAKIGGLLDFKPWVRSWGSDVEVLEPVELREAMMEEVQRMARVYGVGGGEAVPLYQQLWAKTDQIRHTDHTHALIHHMLDVAQVTAALWDHAMPEATRRHFADSMGMDAEATRGWLAFIAGLHDMGKASPIFQALHAPSKRHLEAQGLSFPTMRVRCKLPHGLITTHTLKDLLPQILGMDEYLAEQIAHTCGGHHGTFFGPLDLQALGPSARGTDQWEDLRQALFKALAERFAVPSLPPLPEDLLKTPSFWALLAGLISFADWIGSMEKYFFNLDAPDLTTYAERAYQHAVDALQTLGWLNFTPPEHAVEFATFFGFAPRPLQEAAVALAPQLHAPALAIIEAPTGEGKTEAALYMADYWLHTAQQRGIYIAMPTQATSNQMFGRMRRFLEQRYTGQQVDLHLLHGNAAFSADAQELRLAAMNEDTPANTSAVVAHSWFLINKKRGLLAPFAVGTVDQALMSVLQTKHFCVRLFGLSDKTVIFDEVHAYDTYMTELFQHLLRWLAALNTNVILLSATLPQATRRALVAAYTQQPLEEQSKPRHLEMACYPAITWATADAQGVVPVSASAIASRALTIEWHSRELPALVKELRTALSDGGCAAVICNTVTRAQDIFTALEQAQLVPEENLILFHARFPFARRQAIEEQVLALFGKPVAESVRPERAIIVATQVIEQSLDLDFDLMISDLAPIDLLLQRAGRLHRHYRPNRPAHLSTPRFIITMPEIRANSPYWGSAGYVYAPYILLRTYLIIREYNHVIIPTDVPGLIEAVYTDPDTLLPETATAMLPTLRANYQNMLHRDDKEMAAAQKRLIPWPDDEDIVMTSSRDLDEDNPELHATWRALTRLNPELHATWRALTRLTRPSVTLVCLHQQTDGRVSLDTAGHNRVNLQTKPNRKISAALAQQTLAVSIYPVVAHFVNQPAPAGWQKHPALRYHRAAIFENGQCSLGEIGYLELDPRKGLLFIKSS